MAFFIPPLVRGPYPGMQSHAQADELSMASGLTVMVTMRGLPEIAGDNVAATASDGIFANMPCSFASAMSLAGRSRTSLT